MVDIFKSPSTKSLKPFTEAGDWNQALALAKSDFLDLAKEFIKVHKGEYGKGQALKRFLKAFNGGLIGQDVREKLRRGAISKSTFYGWRQAYRRGGLAGLLEGYGNGGCRIPPVFQEEIKKLIWQNHLCRYQDILDDLRVLFPGARDLPHYSTIRAYAREYKTDNWAALVMKHEGQKGLRDRNMQVALGRADADLTAPNQRWELDTTVADVFTKRKIKDVVLRTGDGKRCKIIAVFEVFSRALKFYLVEKETALMVGLCFRDCIITWGLPEEVIIDNGKPYKNRRFMSFVRANGISLILSIPGNPVQKPHVERGFRTLSEKLFRRLPGFSGNSVANRPNEIEVKYSMAELQEIMDRWVENVYMETVHRSTGQRPRERMSPPGFVPKTINERELDILLMEERDRRVYQGHITYLGGKYFHPKLPEGQNVKFRVNDFDASELLVFFGGKYLCTAVDYRRKGKTPAEIREAKKSRNRELRTRVKANEALINKTKPKGENILDLIDHHEKIRPVELPKKAEVLSFPELINVPYTNTETEGTDFAGPERDAGKVEEGGLRHRDRVERYLDVAKREKRGQSIDELDRRFIEEFEESELFKTNDYKEYLQRKLVGEGL